MTVEQKIKVDTSCPLCGSPTYQIGSSDLFLKCPKCQLIHKRRDSWPSADAELEHYHTHQNNPQDSGYRNFLLRVLGPLMERAHHEDRILDYGCGPTEAAKAILNDHGFCEVTSYDPFFFPSNSAIEATSYAQIVASEVFEHFHNPRKELNKLLHILNEDGKLCVMTSHYPNAESIENWYYTRDPTHVVFFNSETFDFICSEFGVSKCYEKENVVFLKKSPSSISNPSPYNTF